MEDELIPPKQFAILLASENVSQPLGWEMNVMGITTLAATTDP